MTVTVMRMVRARVSEERLHARGGPCAAGVLAAQQGLLRLLCEVAEDAWGGLGFGSRLQGHGYGWGYGYG